MTEMTAQEILTQLKVMNQILIAQAKIAVTLAPTTLPIDTDGANALLDSLLKRAE